MAQQDRFAELLALIAREITRRQASEVCCGDLTLEQFQTMRAVSVSNAATIGWLSSEQRVDLSTMSRNVSVLERNGYLVRARSESDARVVLVTLTAKGRRALETLACSERDVLRDVHDRLPPSERPRVLKSLEALRACLAASDAAGEACCPPPAPRKSLS
jgi:DNA-binding MarR family transcriptional regulator